MASRGEEKIQHPGTFNANPVSAAAGTAALGVIAESDANSRADATASRLRASLNELFAETATAWAAYGISSGFYVFLNPQHRPIDPLHFDPHAIPASDLKQPPAQLADRLRLALLTNGVDVNGRIGGFISATHGDAEITTTTTAFREAIRMLRAEGEL